jgi:predicted transcriptional regulator
MFIQEDKGERYMESTKAKMVEIIREQPEDASYEEIMRELAFRRMVDRGLEDVRTGRTISNEEMAHRIRTWAK